MATCGTAGPGYRAPKEGRSSGLRTAIKLKRLQMLRIRRGGHKARPYVEIARSQDPQDRLARQRLCGAQPKVYAGTYDSGLGHGSDPVQARVGPGSGGIRFDSGRFKMTMQVLGIRP